LGCLRVALIPCLRSIPTYSNYLETPLLAMILNKRIFLWCPLSAVQKAATAQWQN